MQTLTVLLPKDKPGYCEQFRRMIHSVNRHVETSPVTVEWRESSRDHYDVFTFTSWTKADSNLETIKTIYSYVALVIVEWVIQVVEREQIELLLDRNYSIKLTTERKKIYPYVQHAFHSAGDQQKSRKAEMYRQIYRYLEENQQLQLQGYLRFRLKGHWAELEKAVDIGMEEYKQDTEYREFIELLRFFVSIQETKLAKVHLIPGNQNQLFLYDDQKNRMNLERIETSLGLPLQGIQDDDYLVSALIMLAPQTIVLHQATRKQSLAVTLHHIFADRLQLCTACADCAKFQRHILDLAKSTLYNT